MARTSGIGAELQKNWGLPPTLKISSPFPFAGMNQRASRLAIQDQELFYVENYLKVGDGFYRALYDVGSPLYTEAFGRTIINFVSYSIDLTNYFGVFFSDGSCAQVNSANGAVTVISALGSGAFYQPGGSFPATVSWGNIYLLIANRNTANDYWAWDGSLLYTAGTIGPIVNLTASGQDYVAPPAVTTFGGHGSGVNVLPVISNGAVVDLTVLAVGSGYLPGDTVQVRFQDGGSDDGAILNAVLQFTTVNQVAVLAGGTGYTAPPTVVFSGGGGTGAAAVAGVTGGAVVSVVMSNHGAGYTSAPTVTFVPTAGGSGAVGQATLVARGVASATITEPGTNFFGVPILTFKGGIGTGAQATAVLSGPGPINDLTLTNGGSGYTSIPTVSIADSGGGGGTGATAIVSGVSGGVITALTVTNPGSNYAHPLVSFAGGGGTGAAATASLAAGGIVGVTVTNPGAGYIDAPAIIVQPGLNSAASALLELMPFGVSGDSIETYQSQVWVQNPFRPTGAGPTGGVRLSSTPGSISDFATSDGGLAETTTDRFLRRHLAAIRQSNGFLYPFGDSSVGVISNVNVSGAPPTKSLTNQNTDPQVGTVWRDTLQDFGRTVLFANDLGVYGLFGGAVTKVSDPIDNIFQAANFPTAENPGNTNPITPSAAVADIYKKKCYLLLFSQKNPFDGTFANKMVCWNEKEWCVVSQSTTNPLTFIATQEINSDLTAWGTDGTHLYPLLHTPSTTLTKLLSTKLYGSDRPMITKLGRVVYVQAENFASEASAPAFNIVIDTEYASFPSTAPQIAFPLAGQTFPPGVIPPPVQCPLLMAAINTDIPCQEIAITMRSNNSDHAVYYMGVATEDISAIFG